MPLDSSDTSSARKAAPLFSLGLRDSHCEAYEALLDTRDPPPGLLLFSFSLPTT